MMHLPATQKAGRVSLWILSALCIC